MNTLKSFDCLGMNVEERPSGLVVATHDLARVGRSKSPIVKIPVLMIARNESPSQPIPVVRG